MPRGGVKASIPDLNSTQTIRITGKPVDGMMMKVNLLQE